MTLQALVFLSCEWSVTIKAMLTCTKAKNVDSANLIKVIPAEHQGAGAICPIERAEGQTFFFFQRQKFVYNTERRDFSELRYPNEDSPLSDFQKSRGIVSDGDLKTAETLYGSNKFDIPVPTFKELFKEHAVAPFFVFQIFCVGLWCLDEYWYYSIFTLVMLIIFESTVVFQRQRTLNEFRTMSIKPYAMMVRRNNKWVTIQSDELIPGDLVSVNRTKEDSGVPCDLVLLDGACIVNEAMLSGESTPLLKESIALLEGGDALDMNNTHKNNVLFGGTKILQVTPPANDSAVAAAPDGGCLAVVLRTGFGTAQGKLVRTMIFSTERVTANNVEAFLFILFLLFFAIIASWYVWQKGVEKDRKRSKLLLDCVLIITSVVPPELPMELSLAVNSSLIALSKYAIYCTEPFRIPVAGKVDICCFDKTGTLTGEDLVVEGVAGLKSDLSQLMAVKEVPKETMFVLASSHALVLLDDGVVGDPMEKATVEAIDWTIGKGDMVLPPKLSKHRGQINVRRRFQFSSSLKRMSTVSRIESAEYRNLLVSVKGAPETLRTMFVSIPLQYEETYKEFTRKGSRVLALGYKWLDDTIRSEHIKDLSREQVESKLIFAGFLVFHCPLKDDSVETLRALNDSAHRCVMITGDNPLTACHVAKEVDIIEREVLILDAAEGTDSLVWKSVDEKITFPCDPTKDVDKKIIDNYDLCLTGVALKAYEHNECAWTQLVENTWVYARVSPTQKESILMKFKGLGYTTLMAGDGTNDVGALKQAHIGVALLDGKPEDLKRIAEHQRVQRMKAVYEKQLQITGRFGQPPPPVPPQIAQLFPDPLAAQRAIMEAQKEAQRAKADGKPPKVTLSDALSTANSMMDEMEDDVPKIKLGDASVAAPFTSKLSNVVAVANIVKQGRCTLVATIQMYKILALNCLISAYSLSVLYLDGIKFGDFQATIMGMLLSVCFLCISKAKAIDQLAPVRPQSNIFNFYIILSILGQFAVHIAAMLYANALVASYEDPEAEVDLEKKFEPGLLNTAMYLVQLSMSVSTFAINYQGRPFRESIRENKALFYGLLAVGGVAFAGATEFIPEINETLQLVPMTNDFKFKLTTTMALDFGVSWLIEFVTHYLFSDSAPKPITRRRGPGFSSIPRKGGVKGDISGAIANSAVVEDEKAAAPAPVTNGSASKKKRA